MTIPYVPPHVLYSSNSSLRTDGSQRRKTSDLKKKKKKRPGHFIRSDSYVKKAETKKFTLLPEDREIHGGMDYVRIIGATKMKQETERVSTPQTNRLQIIRSRSHDLDTSRQIYQYIPDLVP